MVQKKEHAKKQLGTTHRPRETTNIVRKKLIQWKKGMMKDKKPRENNHEHLERQKDKAEVSQTRAWMLTHSKKNSKPWQEQECMKTRCLW